MAEPNSAEFPVTIDKLELGVWCAPFEGIPESKQSQSQVVFSRKIEGQPNLFHITLNRVTQPKNIARLEHKTQVSEKDERSRMIVLIDGPTQPSQQVYARIFDQPENVFTGIPKKTDHGQEYSEWTLETRSPETGRKAYSEKNPFTSSSLDIHKIEIMIINANNPAKEPIHING